jgi:hypothetical protein
MPPSGENSATIAPEPKSAGGLSNLFKTIAGGTRSSRLPLNISSSSTAVSNVLARSSNRGAYPWEGPANKEHLYHQLKSSKNIGERLQAADALRLLVNDYPLNSVMGIWYAAKDLIDSDFPGMHHISHLCFGGCAAISISDIVLLKFYY